MIDRKTVDDSLELIKNEIRHNAESDDAEYLCKFADQLQEFFIEIERLLLKLVKEKAKGKTD